MIKVLKIVVILSFICFPGWVIYYAARMAIADLIHNLVKNWIKNSDAVNKPVSEAELDKVEDKILRSIRFNPENAEYQEYLGMIDSYELLKIIKTVIYS